MEGQKVVNWLVILKAQLEVQERILQQAPLEEILDAVTRQVELLLPEAIIGFMSFDTKDKTLSLLRSRYFSLPYQECLQSVEVGPDVASFGCAAFYHKPIITEDIRTDSRWSAFYDAAESEGLRACWSTPILTTKNELIGIFSIYFRKPCYPDEVSRLGLEQSAGLLSLAFLRKRDITDLRMLSEWHRSLYLNHPEGVYEFDLTGRFQRGNAALTRITGYHEKELIGRHFNEFIEPAYRELTQSGYDIARQGGTHQYETVGIHRDGHNYRLQIFNFPVSVDGEVVGVYGVCHDITQQREQEVQLSYQATHDLLTGLPNLTFFDECLQVLFKNNRHDQLSFTIMQIGLDGFKTINRSLGYQNGNQLLIAVSLRLRQTVDSAVTLARIGGDEFALLIPSQDSRQSSIELAERILDSLSSPFVIDDTPLRISASIGIVDNIEDVRCSRELMPMADLAMLDAKRQGYNTWCWYLSGQNQLNRDNVQLHHDLHTALHKDQNQFELYYQPIVEAVNGRICGLEALIRWHHPTRGLVSPGVFIPLAEQTGQIVQLGRWILRHACQNAVEMRAKSEQVIPVAVNVSSLQFRRDDFLRNLQEILDETCLPPHLLELEITESVLIDWAHKAIELINALKTMGIRVALDDFGTGYSSLSYLRDLPIHKVKLDRAFIQDIDSNRSHAAIVEGIITMSHHLNLVVVAEGIENQEQQQALICHNCDLLQGFYFAKPMPKREYMGLPNLLPLLSDA